MTENCGCITVVCKAPVRSLKGFEVVLYNADRKIIDSQRTDKINETLEICSKWHRDVHLAG